MNQTNHVFILKTNPSLNFFIEKILDFQIGRIKNYFSEKIHIWDPDNLLDSTKKFNSIKSSNFVELKQFVKSNQNKIFFLIETTDPLLDIKFLKQLNNNDICEICDVKGAIPGTTPKFILRYENLVKIILNNNWWSKIKPSNSIFWETQKFNNNQFDLNRPVRLKIFLKLLKKIPNMKKLSIEDFLRKIDSDYIYNFILDYAENKLRTKSVKICPYCKHKDLESLYFITSQPMIGFLSNKKSAYLKCHNCDLVLLKKQCLIKDLHLLYDDFERPKINKQKSIEDFLKNKGGTHFHEKIKSLEILEKYAQKKSKMMDLGGGFGEFACMAKKRNPLWTVHCVDFNLEHVKSILEKNNIIIHNQNFLENTFGQNFDIVSSLHVIEHIPVIQLENFFKNIYKSLNKNGILLLTTPNLESPLAKIFDYHMMYPPQHQTILSVSWIEKFVKNLKLFKKITHTSASVILEHYDEWFTYYKKTTPTDEGNAVLEIFDMIHENKIMFNKFHKILNKKNLGSESIILFKKI